MPEVLVERRKAPRYPLILAAEVIEQASGARLTARTSDISRGGCYIDTLNPMPFGTTARVILSNAGESFEALATVVYVSPGLGMGIRFEDPVSPKHTLILNNWLESAARSGS